MRKLIPMYCLFAAVMLSSGAVMAKLPPPSPEEQEALAQKKQQEAEHLEKEKLKLELAQNRIAERYGKPGSFKAYGRTQSQNMPKTTSELPRGTGPTPDRPQSAEAHSAPAK